MAVLLVHHELPIYKDVKKLNFKKNEISTQPHSTYVHTLKWCKCMNNVDNNIHSMLLQYNDKKLTKYMWGFTIGSYMTNHKYHEVYKKFIQVN